MKKIKHQLNFQTQYHHHPTKIINLKKSTQHGLNLKKMKIPTTNSMKTPNKKSKRLKISNQQFFRISTSVSSKYVKKMKLHVLLKTLKISSSARMESILAPCVRMIGNMGMESGFRQRTIWSWHLGSGKTMH